MADSGPLAHRGRSVERSVPNLISRSHPRWLPSLPWSSAANARAFADEEAARDLPRVTENIRKAIAAPQTLRRRALAIFVPKSIFRRTRKD